jgi:hypothetical protein
MNEVNAARDRERREEGFIQSKAEWVYKFFCKRPGMGGT